MSAFPAAGIDILEHELTGDILRVDGKKKSLLESLVFKGKDDASTEKPVQSSQRKGVGRANEQLRPSGFSWTVRAKNNG